MTARILVVDDVPANVRLLEARLLAEYFEVVTANDGETALSICKDKRVDVVLLDVMMPGIDGFEVCRRLKQDPNTTDIPVVMVTALDQASDRVRGLESGADDFLTKPVNDLQLMTRVRNLVRFKALCDELRLRAATGENLGLQQTLGESDVSETAPAHILLIDERRTSSKRLSQIIEGLAEVEIVADPQQGFFEAARGDFDAIVVVTGFEGIDPLRICSQLRSFDRTRFTPIILVAESDEESVVLRALELGINDYVTRPVDPQELSARLRTQIRRKRYNDSLRKSVAETLELAVTDGLTGLHNRRYLDTHLQNLFARAEDRERPLSVLMTDLDRFKHVNDTYGHEAGDLVLREFAQRLRRNIRGIDLACRYGGEEFVIVMPDTEPAAAHTIAERIRAEVEGMSFVIGDGHPNIDITVSIGAASRAVSSDSMAALMKRADKALYQAKNAGRNCVVADAA